MDGVRRRPLCRRVDWHAAMSAPVDDHACARTLAGFGSAKWTAKGAAPSLAYAQLSVEVMRSHGAASHYPLL
jgi:hypothetical protein